jgi:Glyoxalase-like domain
MLTRFDHAVVGVRSLDAAMETWRRLGFDPRPGGRHTGRGTHNAIVRFGLDYVELISIDDRKAIDDRGDENALALARLIDSSEGGLLGFALATDDIEADARRFRTAGMALHGPDPMQRVRPDGNLLRWRLLVPAGGSWGTPLPFFIQWDTLDDQRLSWEQPGHHQNGGAGIASVAITVDDLDAWETVYGSQLGLQSLGRNRVEDLGAIGARYRCGRTELQLLAPAGPGEIAAAVAAGHQAPWQITIAVKDLQAAERVLRENGIDVLPAPGNDIARLIPPSSAMQARIALIQPSPAR